LLLQVFALLSIVLGAGYLAWMYYCYSGWKGTKDLVVPPAYIPQTAITVIIPARNEVQNILHCLEAVTRQEYPSALLQVIVVDDHSDDETAELAQSFSGKKVQVIELSALNDPSALYKKRAIEKALEIATGQLIVTTDADCTMGPRWLLTLSYIYEQEHPVLIAGPVIFHPASSLLERFQALDMAGMMLITGATIRRGFYLMCNGANLAYEKSAFHAVNGYRGVDKNPSGDDMMLLHKISAAYPGRVAYAKSVEATVTTAPVGELMAFLQQRFRWTSKASGYQDKRVSAVLAMVYFFNWALVAGIFAGILFPHTLYWVLPLFLLKFLADFAVLKMAANFFGQAGLMRSFWPAQALHIAYIVFVGTLGNFMPYTWKGRKISR